jgi:hypothetical protein
MISSSLVPSTFVSLLDIHFDNCSAFCSALCSFIVLFTNREEIKFVCVHSVDVHKDIDESREIDENNSNSDTRNNTNNLPRDERDDRRCRCRVRHSQRYNP